MTFENCDNRDLDIQRGTCSITSENGNPAHANAATNKHGSIIILTWGMSTENIVRNEYDPMQKQHTNWNPNRQ